MRKRSVVGAMHEVVSGAHSSGKTKGKIGCHAARSRASGRGFAWDGREQALPSWQTAITYVGLATGP
jgi:hypothetical protein